MIINEFFLTFHEVASIMEDLREIVSNSVVKRKLKIKDINITY